MIVAQCHFVYCETASSLFTYNSFFLSSFYLLHVRRSLANFLHLNIIFGDRDVFPINFIIVN